MVIVSGLALFYRLLSLLFKSVRCTAIASHCRFSQRKLICSVLDHCSLGDWFLLDLLSKNIDPINFRDLMLEFVSQLEPQKVHELRPLKNDDEEFDNIV